ncbi:hypothetical protein KSF73_00930 [Burkholderiaceae bacterium DAT-1]|nr:hypothetical protein [Burkholderiaceae bacterium DAT-1]
MERILSKELDLWKSHYNNGMRHLFTEEPYFTAEFKNIWMKDKDDHILEELINDFKGTFFQSPYFQAFYKNIKICCPETVFHGTDIGHKYYATGARFKKYLEDHALTHTDQYKLTLEAIDQGARFYDGEDGIYRENQMARNFIRELKSINGADVMGIYGGTHVRPGGKDADGAVINMLEQIKLKYGPSIQVTNLAYPDKLSSPIRVDQISINGKMYSASYYGKVNWRGFKNIDFNEYWRLEGAYSDLASSKKINSTMEYDEFPMAIEKGQVIIEDVVTSDKKVYRSIYRTDGTLLNGQPVAEELSL